MVSLVNSHTNATRIGWHLRKIDLRFTPGLRPGWWGRGKDFEGMVYGLWVWVYGFGFLFSGFWFQDS